MDETGNSWVRVEDTEVFDMVEDHLSEQHNLEYDTVLIQDGRPFIYKMIFRGDRKSELIAALDGLSRHEVRRVYLLNNPADGPSAS